MTFTVKYRNKTGAVCEICIEADSRALCIAECHRQGITPLGVKEGRDNKTKLPQISGHRGIKKDRTHTARPSYILLVVVFIVALAGTWLWVSMSSDKQLPHEEEIKKSHVEMPREVKPSVSAKTNTAGVSIAKAIPQDTYLGQPVLSRSCVTNADGSVRELIRTADGKVHGKRYPPPGSEPIFDNAADQAIAMALSVSDTVSAAPLPGMGENLDEEFAKALDKPIEIKSDDPQPVKELKKMVMETREEIRQLMAKGQTFSQVLNEHVRLARENYDIRAKAFIELKEMVEAGDMESATKYRESVNKVLGEMGVTALDMPMTADEREAKREAIRQERERILKEKNK